MFVSGLTNQSVLVSIVAKHSVITDDVFYRLDVSFIARQCVDTHDVLGGDRSFGAGEPMLSRGNMGMSTLGSPLSGGTRPLSAVAKV